MTDTPSGASAVPPPPGLGQRLAQAREHRGLSVLQAAEKLHLEPRVLEALEAENFEAFGAAVYVRGHLQRYAELLGENVAELQALYAGLAHAHTTPDLTQVITERNRGAVPGARVGVWQGGLLTLALVVVALVWWAMRSGPVQPPAPETVTVVPPAQPQVAPNVAAAPTTRAAAPAPSAAPAARAMPVAPRAEHPAASPPPPAVATRANAAATPAAPAVVASAPPAPAADAPAAANGARVVLRFREDSWAEVYDAHGAALYRDIATAGSVHELSGAPPLRLVLGNAAGVGISVNGRNVSLGAALQATPNAQFSLDRGGRVTEAP